PFLGDAEGAPRNAEAADAEPLPEVWDRARPEGHVDLRIQREQPLPLRLRVATPDGDHRVGTAPLLRDRVADVGGELRVRLFPDRAGVEDDDVRLFACGGLTETEVLE